MKRYDRLSNALVALLLGSLMACAHNKSGANLSEMPQEASHQKMALPIPEGLNEADAADWILKQSQLALGSEKIAVLKSRTRETTTTLIGQGIQLEGVTHWVGMEKVYTKEAFPGLGNIVTAFDGNIAWSQDPILGLRQLEGAELSQIRQAGLGVEADYSTFFPTRSLIETIEEGDVTLYHIQLTPTEGEDVHSFIDAGTFLPLRQETVAISPQGQIPVVATVSDYRLVDGMLVPHKIRSVMGPISMEQVVTRVSHNEDIDAALFSMPKQ